MNTAAARSPLSALAVLRKLDALSPLAEQDALMLTRTAESNIRHARPREDLISEGDRPNGLRIVLSGWACRYKVLEDGRRQILGFLLPGDSCDINMNLVARMDHSIGALTPISWAELSPAALQELTTSCPSIARAFLCESLSEMSMQREWTVNLGQRVAVERLAHLFCETFLRLRVIGLTTGTTCVFPPTQADLGDATGLSNVHVNRSLQELRRVGLIELAGKTLTIPNLEALETAGLFEPSYLHFRELSRERPKMFR